MFAPKIPKPQTKTAADSSSLVRPRSTLAAQRHSPAEQAVFLQRTIGNQATLRLLARIVQRKLVVGQASDPLEREADRAADQVMRMPDPALSLVPGGSQLRRKNRLSWPSQPLTKRRRLCMR